MASEGDVVDIGSFAPAGPFVVAPDGTVKFSYEPNGSLRATLQDSTAPFFQYFIQDEQKTDIALTSPVAVGDEVINVDAGHGFTAVAGEHITLFEDNKYAQIKVKSVATNAITLQWPTTTAFTIAGATVMRGNININVDGSVTPVEFMMELRNFTIPLDISKVIITMQHAGVPDDGKFGGIAALANGLFFKKENDSTFSFGNYAINQDFRNMGGEVIYTQKAPAGAYATNITFDLNDIFGQVIRLHPDTNDKIVGIVRDVLTAVAGLSNLTVSFIGHYTEGEA